MAKKQLYDNIYDVIYSMKIKGSNGKITRKSRVQGNVAAKTKKEAAEKVKQSMKASKYFNRILMVIQTH